MYVSRFGQTVATIPSGSAGSIDAQGATVVYVGSDGLHVFLTAQKQDTVVLRGPAPGFPSISADGKRILFLSNNVPAAFFAIAHELYAVNADGTGLQDLTGSHDPSGVTDYALSDDGQVAWYTTADGRFVKLDLNTGQPVATFRPPMVDLAPVLVPGSAVNLPAQSLPTDPGSVQVTIGGITAPLLALSATGITFQVPWEVQAGQAVTIQVTTGDSTVQGSVTPVASRPVILPSSASADFAAVHQDWSGYVTTSSPALEGEIVYFYGTGFGPVVAQPATGTPAPDTPVSLLSPLNCNAEVLYAGLAPALVGYYQLTIRLPDSITPQYPEQGLDLQCGPDAKAFVPMYSFHEPATAVVW